MCVVKPEDIEDEELRYAVQSGTLPEASLSFVRVAEQFPPTEQKDPPQLQFAAIAAE